MSAPRRYDYIISKAWNWVEPESASVLIDTEKGHWQVNRRGDVSGQLLGESKVSCGLMDAGLLSPDAERRGTSAPIACRSHEMTARSEVTVDHCVRREELLCLPGRLEALHLPLSSPSGSM